MCPRRCSLESGGRKEETWHSFKEEAMRDMAMAEEGTTGEQNTGVQLKKSTQELQAGVEATQQSRHLLAACRPTMRARVTAVAVVKKGTG